jgi:uncharacterized protein
MRPAAIIVGEVIHERFRPASHAFTYPLFCLRLPLSRLDMIDPRALPINRRGLIAFIERDHGSKDGQPLFAWAKQLLVSNRVSFDDATLDIELTAFPRMFGYVFNPVSFWVCRHREDQVIAVIAEVNNTFGESHSYLLTPPEHDAIANGDTLFAVKQLHVSPFNEVRGSYSFRFNFSAERWMARIDYADNEEHGRLLHTHISGEARALTRSHLRGVLFRFPLQSFSVVARIHWQALRLAIKRVPFHGKLVSRMTGISRS